MFSTNASENLTLDEIPGPSGLSAEEKAEMNIRPEVMPGTSAIPPRMDARAEADLHVNEEISVLMVTDSPANQEAGTEREPQPEPAAGLQVQPPEPDTTELDEEREETRSELEARIAKIPTRPNVTINLENGKIIVQELDTPKIRREKARQRKAEKAAAAAQSAPKAEVAAIQDDASDLSSLSDLESERGDDDGDGDERPVIAGEEMTSKVTPEVPVVAARRVPRGPAALITTGSALILLEPGERLEGGTLGTLA
jgi:NuA3 HAT complex component NTO1